MTDSCTLKETRMFWTIVLLMVLVGFYCMFPKSCLQICDTVRSKVAHFSFNFWKSDPIAIKNNKINEKSTEIATAVEEAETSQKLINSLERQINRTEAEANRLQALAEQYVKDGNDNKATEKLEEKEKLDLDLEENKNQLVVHKKMFDNHMTQINRSAGQISKLKKQAKSQGTRLQFAKADANLTRMSKLMGKSVDFSDFSEVDDAIEEKIDGYKAVREVAEKLHTSDNEDAETEAKIKNAKVQSKLEALKQSLIQPKSSGTNNLGPQ